MEESYSMAISSCSGYVGAENRELISHGTPEFPAAAYHDDLKKNPVSWHWHEELEVFVVESGKAEIRAGSHSLLLTPGQGLFINGGILHSCKNAGPASCRLHSLVFHPRLCGGSPGSVFWLSYLKPLLLDPDLDFLFLDPGISWQSVMIREAENAWSAMEAESSGFEFSVRESLSRLLLSCFQNRPKNRSHSTEKSRRDNERMKAMLSYIKMHLSESMTVGDIAKAASVSESECLRCFRSAIGTTPIRYLREYRLERACELLTETNLSLAEIASACGFQDMSYFSKSFRESKGTTPTGYRAGRN